MSAISYTCLCEVTDNDVCVHVNKRPVYFVIVPTPKLAHLSPRHIRECKL